VQKRKIASIELTLLLRMSKEKFSLWTNPFFKPITSIPQRGKAVEAIQILVAIAEPSTNSGINYFYALTQIIFHMPH
jgi:hypothetical protein